MKNFIGKNSLKSAMTLMKGDLSKKEDLVSDFTNEQVAEMYGSTTIPGEIVVPDYHTLLIFPKNNDTFVSAKSYIESISKYDTGMLRVSRNFSADRFPSEDEFENAYAINECQYTFIIGNVNNLTTSSPLESIFTTEEFEKYRSTEGVGFGCLLNIPEGNLYISASYVWRQNGTNTKVWTLTCSDVPDHNDIAILNIQGPGFVRNVKTNIEQYSFDFYVL